MHVKGYDILGGRVAIRVDEPDLSPAQLTDRTLDLRAGADDNPDDAVRVHGLLRCFDLVRLLEGANPAGVTVEVVIPQTVGNDLIDRIRHGVGRFP